MHKALVIDNENLWETLVLRAADDYDILCYDPELDKMVVVCVSNVFKDVPFNVTFYYPDSFTLWDGESYANY